ILGSLTLTAESTLGLRKAKVSSAITWKSPACTGVEILRGGEIVLSVFHAAHPIQRFRIRWQGRIGRGTLLKAAELVQQVRFLENCGSVLGAKFQSIAKRSESFFGPGELPDYKCIVITPCKFFWLEANGSIVGDQRRRVNSVCLENHAQASRRLTA